MDNILHSLNSHPSFILRSTTLFPRYSMVFIFSFCIAPKASIKNSSNIFHDRFGGRDGCTYMKRNRPKNMTNGNQPTCLIYLLTALKKHWSMIRETPIQVMVSARWCKCVSDLFLQLQL